MKRGLGSEVSRVFHKICFDDARCGADYLFCDKKRTNLYQNPADLDHSVRADFERLRKTKRISAWRNQLRFVRCVLFLGGPLFFGVLRIRGFRTAGIRLVFCVEKEFKRSKGAPSFSWRTGNFTDRRYFACGVGWRLFWPFPIF